MLCAVYTVPQRKGVYFWVLPREEVTLGHHPVSNIFWAVVWADWNIFLDVPDENHEKAPYLTVLMRR